jgi:hypothetical protein
LNSVSRYIRAFVVALRMTVRGEKPPPLRHPEFYAWIREMVVLVDRVIAAADQSGLDQTAIVVRLDSRPMSLEKVLQILRYHAAQEYPSLLRTSATRRFNLSAIHATNMNDQHWLSRLRQESALQNPDIQAALARLSDHLNTIPSLSPSQSGSS